MIACPDCGLLQVLPRLKLGDHAECRLCEGDLERSRARSISFGLACALGTFILLFPGNILLAFSVGIFGMHNESRLSSGIFLLWDHGWIVLAALTGAFALVLPFVRFGLLSTVLATLEMGRRPRWLGPTFRWALWLDVWAMPDVYLLAGFVGYFRLIHVTQMSTHLHAGALCLMGAAALAMLSRASIDRRSVWRSIAPEATVAAGEPTVSCTVCDLVQPLACADHGCPRCGARLRARKRAPMIRAAALTLAAFVLFFPSNIMPMNVSVQMGSTVRYTIFEGVKELFKAGLWPLGIIIFCTSIGIPAVKILGMAWLLWSVHRKSTRHLVLRTKFHRFITEIGRWSNVDPFAITVFGPLMTFRTLASSEAGWGSTAFILVVVLTLLATLCFDSRIMWDVAERRPS